MSENRGEFTVETARSAAESETLASWVVAFLASPGSDNAELGDQLDAKCTTWLGPLEVPFVRLHRLAGPADQPTLERLDDDDMETVDAMEESIDDGWAPPPFVVTWRDDHLVLEDGTHRVEGLRQSGHDSYWCVIGFDSDESRSRFEGDESRSRFEAEFDT